MSPSEFVAYLGDADIHDGRIQAVETGEFGLDVRIQGASGKQFTVRFSDVEHVESRRPEGMMLYALVELENVPPRRRFQFANWDSEDERRLTIVARDFEIIHGE